RRARGTRRPRFGQAVIADLRGQGNGSAHHRPLHRSNRNRRRLVWIVQPRAQVSPRLDHALDDFFGRKQMPVSFLGPAMGGQGPSQFLVPEIRRNLHSKNPLAPSRQKVCWLTLIFRTWLKFVSGSGRNREFFLIVPIEVSEYQRERPVGVPDPAVK